MNVKKKKKINRTLIDLCNTLSIVAQNQPYLFWQDPHLWEYGKESLKSKTKKDSLKLLIKEVNLYVGSPLLNYSTDMYSENPRKRIILSVYYADKESWDVCKNQ